MPTQKIDPKVIFASNAPAIDNPPVFSDKTKGWDVARANDGRPTIKEMNKVQQDTDLKILWLNENSVTPYDESIDYPDGAVALKDGSFKQLASGAWVEFLDDFADKVEVNAALLAKTDKTYVDAQLALKADKSEVSTGISKFYPTLAEANADIANIAVNQPVNISESQNFGLWHKATAGATTLAKSPYDPLTQAKADATTKANAAEANAKSYVDGKIKKTIVSRNLVDPATIKNGYTLNSSGAEIVSASFHLTDFIEAKPSDVYSKTAPTGVWCEYDVSKSLVKYTTNAQTITTQANTKYIRASLVNSQVLAVVNDGVLGDIDEYSEVETVGSVSETLDLIQPHLIDTINAAKLTSDNLDFLKRDSVNLFDSAHLITDKRFVLSTAPNVYAALTTNTFYNTSKLIPIEPSTEYKHSGCGKWVQYDANMNVVASRSTDFYVVFEFTSDANAKYFQFDFAKSQSNGSNIIFSKKSEYPISYVPYQRYIIDNGIAFDNPWRNKNVLWLGTSIPTGGGYPENVSKNLWANLNKQSGNGGRARAFKSDGSWFAQSEFGFQFTLSKADINTRYGAMLGKTVRANDYLVEDVNGVVLTQAMLDALTSSNYEARLLPYIPSTDLFMIDFGINDRNGQLPNISVAFKTCEELEALGKLYDRSEYVGGVNFLIKQIVDAKQAASMNNFQIVIVSHYTRSERHIGTNNVVKAQENIAKYWGFPFINLADNAGVNTLNINLLTNNSDGLHFSANSVIEKRVTRFITSRLRELAM